MKIIDRVLNDKKGKQVVVLQIPDTADRVEHEGKVYRRPKKDGEFEGEDFHEVDEPSMMRKLTRPNFNAKLIR